MVYTFDQSAALKGGTSGEKGGLPIVSFSNPLELDDDPDSVSLSLSESVLSEIDTPSQSPRATASLGSLTTFSPKRRVFSPPHGRVHVLPSLSPPGSNTGFATASGHNHAGIAKERSKVKEMCELWENKAFSEQRTPGKEDTSLPTEQSKEEKAEDVENVELEELGQPREQSPSSLPQQSPERKVHFSIPAEEGDTEEPALPQITALEGEKKQTHDDKGGLPTGIDSNLLEDDSDTVSLSVSESILMELSSPIHTPMFSPRASSTPGTLTAVSPERSSERLFSPPHGRVNLLPSLSPPGSNPGFGMASGHDHEVQPGIAKERSKVEEMRELWENKASSGQGAMSKASVSPPAEQSKEGKAEDIEYMEEELEQPREQSPLLSTQQSPERKVQFSIPEEGDVEEVVQLQTATLEGETHDTPGENKQTHDDKGGPSIDIDSNILENDFDSVSLSLSESIITELSSPIHTPLHSPRASSTPGSLTVVSPERSSEEVFSPTHGRVHVLPSLSPPGIMAAFNTTSGHDRELHPRIVKVRSKVEGEHENGALSTHGMATEDNRSQEQSITPSPERCLTPKRKISPLNMVWPPPAHRDGEAGEVSGEVNTADRSVKLDFIR